MTAAGLIATALVLGLLFARELARLRAQGDAPPRPRLQTAILPVLLVWAVLVAVRLADYLG